MSHQCEDQYVIHDVHTGDAICSACGKIVGPSFQDIPIHQYHSPAWCPGACDFLIDVCSNNNISFCMIDDACEYLKKYSAENLHHSSNKKVLAAKALYETCFKHQVPRSIKEISDMCNIKEHDLSALCGGICELLPSDLVERILQRLDTKDPISFQLTKEIKKKANYFFDNILDSSPPKSSIALALIHFVNKGVINANMRQIAQACHISLVCLRRLCYKYPSYIHCSKKGIHAESCNQL